MASRSSRFRSSDGAVAFFVLHPAITKAFRHEMAALLACAPASVGVFLRRRDAVGMGAQHPSCNRATLLDHLPKLALARDSVTVHSAYGSPQCNLPWFRYRDT